MKPTLSVTEKFVYHNGKLALQLTFWRDNRFDHVEYVYDRILW